MRTIRVQLEAVLCTRIIIIKYQYVERIVNIGLWMDQKAWTVGDYPNNNNNISIRHLTPHGLPFHDNNEKAFKM